MKPRNREISIFNLSMMDVISGAMGAFLILVIILSRHYDANPVTTETLLALQRELVEATGYLDDASRKIHADSHDTVDIERFLRKAKDNVNAGRAAIAKLRNELSAADARIRLLDEQVKQLQGRIADLQDEIEWRQPFLFEALWNCDGFADVDVYLQSSVKSQKGTRMPPFRPDEEQGRYFSDELYLDATGRFGYEAWLFERTSMDNRIKVYYKLSGDARPECRVDAGVFSNNFPDVILPEATLNAKLPWYFAGALVVDQDRKVSFEAASEQERREELAAVEQRAAAQ